MTKKMSLTELKKELRKKTDYELVEEIAHLYKTFPHVKEYYQASFFGDDTCVLENYKEKIRHEFIPKNDYSFPDARLSVARKAVSDYKKVSTSNVGLADIMLTYVESGIIFAKTFGDIDEPFYNSMESMYKRACEFIKKHDLFYDFDKRLKNCVSDTSHMGWGFHDQLGYFYEIYFGDYPT